MDDENDVKKMIDKFYNLKAEYEQKHIEKVKNAKKSNENWQNKVKNFRKYCINCKKECETGMEFKIYKNQLSVQCCSEKDPCDLYINVKVPIARNYYTHYSLLRQELEELMRRFPD